MSISLNKRIEMTLLKIAKRLRLAELCYHIKSFVCSFYKSPVKQLPNDVASALQLLHSYSADPGYSCIHKHEFAAPDCDVEVSFHAIMWNDMYANVSTLLYHSRPTIVSSLLLSMTALQIAHEAT